MCVWVWTGTYEFVFKNAKMKTRPQPNLHGGGRGLRRPQGPSERTRDQARENTGGRRPWERTADHAHASGRNRLTDRRGIAFRVHE